MNKNNNNNEKPDSQNKQTMQLCMWDKVKSDRATQRERERMRASVSNRVIASKCVWICITQCDHVSKQVSEWVCVLV